MIITLHPPHLCEILNVLPNRICFHYTPVIAPKQAFFTLHFAARLAERLIVDGSNLKWYSTPPTFFLPPPLPIVFFKVHILRTANPVLIHCLSASQWVPCRHLGLSQLAACSGCGQPALILEPPGRLDVR